MQTHLVEVRLVYNARTYFGKDVANAVDNKVFAVEDAIKKAANTTSASDHSVATNTIAGIIEANSSLPLDVAGTPTPTAEHAIVVRVDYPALSNERGFQSFEVIVTVQVKGIGNRG